MEKQLGCVSILSLQEMAFRKVAILLWNEPNSMFLVENYRNRSNIKYWHRMEYWHHPEYWHRRIESKVSRNVSKLQLPESLAKQMIRILKPIGLQIIRWKLYHEAFLNDSNEFFNKSVLQKLHWTAAGTVDFRKTAEELVRCDVFDIVKRYQLACLYCLDHYIPELWKELPQKHKRNFYNETIPLMTSPPLHYCWPYILKGEEYKLRAPDAVAITFNQLLFQRSSSQGNEAATKYFFQKLSPEEKEASLVSAARSVLISRSRGENTYPSTFPNKNISDVMCYLLSLMTPEQRVEIFRERPVNILECFLDWPRQDAFLDVCDSMLTWMRCEDLERRARNYNALISKLLSTIQYSDYYTSDLYQNFFLGCPGDFRKHFVEREISVGGFFLSTLFKAKDVETVNVILSNVDAGDRLRLVSSRYLVLSFYIFISIGSGDAVETCLRDTGLSKEDKASLKEALMECLNREKCVSNELKTPKWRRFFEFLDEIDPRTEIKRMSDDDALTEAKKLRRVKQENSTIM